jgi:prepilin-type N-terminal cleavage/methylation domain-containing protein
MNIFLKNKIYINNQGETLTKKKLNRGFTLVELLVTITMFVIITGVVLVNSNKFDSTVLLHNFAYDVALTVKQAQSYGVNVRESSVIGVSNSSLFNYGYGVYFNTDPTLGAGGSKTNYIFYNDTTNQINYDNNTIGGPDRMFNGSLTSCTVDDLECLQKYSMQKGTHVERMCAGGLDQGSCDINDNHSINILSILFYRPNLAALIYYKADNSSSGLSTSTYARIVLASADGATSTVVVTSVGQIFVKE